MRTIFLFFGSESDPKIYLISYNHSYSKVFDMLDKVADTTELSKATIVETYVARGLENWFKEYEPNSPVFKKWLEFNKKQKL